MAISGPETFRKSEDVRIQELSRELLYALCSTLSAPRYPEVWKREKREARESRLVTP